MPNTPVSIEQGVSAIIGNEYSSLAHIKWTEHFFSTLGKTVVLEKESMMDVVTAISGSGPAYIFNFAEILIGVSNDLGIPEEITKTMETVAGKPPSSTYVQIDEIPRDQWSVGGKLLSEK